MLDSKFTNINKLPLTSITHATNSIWKKKSAKQETLPESGDLRKLYVFKKLFNGIWQKRWIQISHCELSIYMLQNSNIFCKWGMCISVSGYSGYEFSWYRIPANKEATEPSWSYHFVGCTVTIMTWFTVKE